MRPALKAAVAVARAGEAADPPVRAPAALRKVVGFARLNQVALATIRRTVDRDDAFRSRVADEVDEAKVGRASWLWLARPDRWDEELEAMAGEAADADDAGEEARSAQAATRLQRALDAAERAVRRAEEARRRAEQDASTARQALTTERDARAVAEERVRSLQAEQRILADERSAAVRALKDAEAAHGSTRAERTSLRARLREMEGEVARLGHLVTEQGARRPLEPIPAPAAARPEPPPIDVRVVARSVREAASAAAALSDALRQASAELDPPAGASSDVRAVDPTPPVRTRAGRSGRPRRRPSSLPAAMFEEAPEAAEHLVRLPGAVVLVDGYNVSMAAWPTLPIEDQRARLVAALAELHARTGVDPLVVFDGVVAGPGPTGSAPRSVRVRFTDDGVEADDVVMALVDEFPPDQPVVVASSDQRVRDGARRRGANLLTAPQMLAVMSRRRTGGSAPTPRR